MKEAFELCEQTQTYIFINSKAFAEKVHNWLRKENYSSYIMFSKMDKQERDKVMEKFRNLEISVLITTNMIARGIDVPEAQLVINYDVPVDFNNKPPKGDAETYMHRIGRGGRFGRPAIALTLHNREQDKEMLYQILDRYKMKEKMQVLQGADHLKQLLKEINEQE